MQITDVEAITLHIPLDFELHHAQGAFDSRSTVLVKIHTDGDTTGIGEAAFFTGPSRSTATIIEEELTPRILGRDPRYPERIWEDLFRQTYWGGRGGPTICAMSGIDIALWDLYGKLVEEPVHRLLGGYADRVRAYASGGYYSDPDDRDRLVEEMRDHVADGFRAVKMKTGWDVEGPTEPPDRYGPPTPNSLDRDIERIRAVREAVGPDVALMIDSNNGWDPSTTIRVANRLDEVGLYFIEEPVTTEDREGMKHIRDSVDVPIAGCETAYTRYAFRDLLADGCLDVVQPGVNWAGGITECRRIAALAAAHDCPVVPNSFHSAVNLTAAIHLTCAIPNGPFVEYDRTRANMLTTDLIRDPITIDDEGYVAPRDAPGLGIELDDEFVEAHRVDPSV